MKYYIVLLTILIFLCSNIKAQERFNNIYYNPNGNASISMIENDGSFYVLTVTGVNYSNELLGLYKIDNYGELNGDITAGLENNYIFGGFNNLYSSIYGDFFYSCGDLTNMTDFSHTIYISIIDPVQNMIEIDTITLDSVFTTYDITQINDSLWALAIQGLDPLDFAGLVIYDLNNETVLYRHFYDFNGLESNGLSGAINKTFDNGFIIGGHTSAWGIGDFKKDWLLIKTDSVGTLIWERHYGNLNENDGRIMAMLESKDSAYIVAGGQAICNWSMNPISEAALRKIDTSGNLVWERFYRRYDFQNSQSLMRYSNIYIGDIVELESGDFIAITSFARADGGTLLLLLKLTANGEVLWSKHLHTTDALGSNYCSSIKATEDGGYIINGYGSFDFTYDPPQQFFLIKTDSLGCEGELYPAPPTENVECPNFPDTMYCDGTYNSRLQVQGKSAPYTLEFSTGEIVENLYYPPVFIPKSQGTGSFTVHVGVDTYNHSYDTATLYNPIPAEDMEPDIIELPFILTIPENYFGPDLTVTITNGFGESYEITLPVYVDCNVSAEQITENANISVYPNPASDFLQISLPESEENTFVKIINSLGQSVLVEQLFNTETKLNISGLPAGSYIARIYCGNKIENLRFEKM